MNIKKTTKEVDEFSVKTQCGKKIIKGSSEKIVKHNLKMHVDYCKECQDENKKNK